MSYSIKLLLGLTILPFVFFSCGDDDSDDTLVITVDDAAEYVAASMAVATYGALYNMDYVADQITDRVDCNESESDTRTDSETSNNGDIMVNFTISESYSLTCEGNGEVISYNFSADQTTTSERLDTDHEIVGAWTIDGAEEASTVLTYDGTYSRGGEWTYNLEDNHTDNVTTTFVFTDVQTTKEDNIIFEGTSTFSLSGTSTIYEPFSYEGDIVFQPNNISIATFSTGEQYEINLNTGEVTPL